jgi:hypothetical protein
VRRPASVYGWSRKASQLQTDDRRPVR